MMSHGDRDGLEDLPSLADTLVEAGIFCQAQYPLAKLTWFRTGGAADLFVRVESETQLQIFLRELGPLLPLTILGAGSNVLIRDGGIRGAVLMLGRGFSWVRSDDEVIVAGGATPDVKLAREGLESSVGGLSFLRGIPGSVGGAVKMNAGAASSEIKDVLHSARVIDRLGNTKIYMRSDLEFSYRQSSLPENAIVTEVSFVRRTEDQDLIKAELEAVRRHRQLAQPINKRTGGSTFKNPAGGSVADLAAHSDSHSAWRLIDSVGGRGLRHGGAQVSMMHCNFLVNDANATSADIESLGEELRRRVFEMHAIDLEWEIKRLGEALHSRADD